ncbi:MAG: hypothetical protein J0H04_05600 [Hyphomicrobium denitrificans]|nr:hypothetical protein [Hyphomicrobium denitrificans]
MSITISSTLAAAAIATMASAVLSSTSWVNALPYVDVSASPEMWNAASAARKQSARSAKRGLQNQFASAVRPLDLHKLTMADFGDVDASR